jgi:DNA-binding LacI/PurR family transcriptional regulator
MTISRDKVAEIAGVSPVTVSRVFRNSSLVTPETRQRVLAAGQKCGYFPNAAARAIRKGRFNRIAGVVVQYGSKGTSYNPNNGFFDPAVNELAEHGYSLVLEPMHLNILNDSFFEPPRLFSELAVDGILGLPSGGIVPPQVDEHLVQLGAPTVWMCRNPGQHPHSVVGDEETNGRVLTRHLIELGHRRIGYITFESPNYELKDRCRGVTKELQAAGLDTSNVLVGPRASCLVDLSEQMLNRSPRPTAVVCFHRGAYDAMSHTAMRRGIKVPEELSICYFASPWQLVLSDYRPTALEFAEHEIAVTAVRRLLDLIEGRKPAEEIRPIAGTLRPGWTTAAPGRAWADGIEHCEHDRSKCLYLDRMENWSKR